MYSGKGKSGTNGSKIQNKEVAVKIRRVVEAKLGRVTLRDLQAAIPLTPGWVVKKTAFELVASGEYEIDNQNRSPMQLAFSNSDDSVLVGRTAAAVFEFQEIVDEFAHSIMQRSS